MHDFFTTVLVFEAGLSFSLVLATLILSTKFKAELTSVEAREKLKEKKTALYVGGFFGIAAFVFFVFLEMMEAGEVLNLLDEYALMENLLVSVQLLFLIFVQAITLSLVVEVRKSVG